MRLTFCLLSLAVHAGAWSATPRIQARTSLTSGRGAVLSGGAAKPPFTLLVTVEIKEDRIDEFLAAMAIDAAGSRTEDGCVRFDLLRDQASSNKFHFVEVYDLGKYPCAGCTIVSQPEWRNPRVPQPARLEGGGGSWAHCCATGTRLRCTRRRCTTRHGPTSRRVVACFRRRCQNATRLTSRVETSSTRLPEAR